MASGTGKVSIFYINIMDGFEKTLIGLLVFVIVMIVLGFVASSRHNSDVNRWLSACRSQGGLASLVAQNRVECFDKNNQIIYLKICEQIDCN